jgi:hypothetical protein
MYTNHNNIHKRWPVLDYIPPTPPETKSLAPPFLKEYLLKDKDCFEKKYIRLKNFI